MKHNTHIYIAAKAIEFLQESVKNLRTLGGGPSRANTRPISDKAKWLQRLMRCHQADLMEASWAPDDILNDKSRFHTFKLYTPDVLPDRAKEYRKETYADRYFRGSGGGGVPFKVDHLAAMISDLRKLRDYNDNFSVRELQYLYLLISHYVVDAHVPMHCDLRDDPPSPTDKKKPGPKERYFPSCLHNQVEEMWDRAATPVAVGEGLVVAETYKDHGKSNELSPYVTFDIRNKTQRDSIRPVNVPDDNLMEFMIDRCIRSYERSLATWPPKRSAADFSKRDVAPDTTREIFADAIGGVISVWLSI